MATLPKALASLLATFLLLVTSVAVLHQTHQYSTSLAPHTARLSFLAVASPLLSVVTYISPIGSVLAMVRSGDTIHFPIQVIIAQCLQNVASLAYGLLIQNEALYFSSGAGLLFQLMWVTAWYSVARRRWRQPIWKALHPALACLGSLVTILACIFLLTLCPHELVGMVSCALTLALCVSPLASLGIVVRRMNSASIPLVMSIVMLIANASWAVYGILLEDVFVFLPSIFGFCITVFQLLVSAWCNGVLFYDLAFLKWMYAGYQPVDGDDSSQTPPLPVSRRSSSEQRSASP